MTLIVLKMLDSPLWVSITMEMVESMEGLTIR